MIKVSTQKLHHVFNAHRRLNLLEFNLKYLILLRLLETEQFCSIVLRWHNLHSQELGRRSWPTLVRLCEHEALRRDDALILCLVIIPLLHLFHPSSLLLGGTLHLCLNLIINVVSLSSFLFFAVFEAEGTELLGWLSKELLELFLVWELPPIHAKNRFFAAHDDT